MPLGLTRADLQTLVRRGLVPASSVPLEWRDKTAVGRFQGRAPDLGGIYFRSKWEVNRARYLQALIARGLVIWWLYEPTWFTFPVTRGCREYRPDFRVYYPDRPPVFEEVKGFMDQKSKTRLKRMAKYYPAHPVTVIGREWFAMMERTGLAAAIPGWERL